MQQQNNRIKSTHKKENYRVKDNFNKRAQAACNPVQDLTRQRRFQHTYQS